jgi:hypothetical protein
MTGIHIDPSEYMRKNAHIWYGEKTLVWYHERLDGSFAITVLYNYGDVKRRLCLEVNDSNKKTEFKNDEISDEKFEELRTEIEAVKNMLDKNN